MDPLTLALIMGGGAAIKGIGQGISSYQAAEGMMGEEEKKMLKRLQREQEMGALGFSDQEISDLTRTYRNPQQAMAKAQADELKAAMGGMGGGPSDAFKLALAQRDMQDKQIAAVSDKVAQANLAERKREENLLMALSNKAAAQEAAKRAAITQAVTLGIGGAAETAGQAYLLSEETAPGTGVSTQILQDYETYQQMQKLEKLLMGE